MSELAVVVVETMHSPELADALKQAESETSELNDWQKANLREARAFHARYTAVDSKLVEELTSTSLATEVAWREMRKNNNWKDFSWITRRKTRQPEARWKTYRPHTF